MAFVACHLPPFGENKEIRAKQLTNMVKFLRPKTSRIIIAGDMNMRKAENTIVTQLELDDAFILGNSPKSCRFSWDGYKNPFNSNNYPFTCRFDRVFLQDFKVSQFQFVGDTPVTRESDHFLSDHFGLLVEIH
jgi:endonuclease/exonuclease/phosphatase family metal-dependent hydrolase